MRYLAPLTLLLAASTFAKNDDDDDDRKNNDKNDNKNKKTPAPSPFPSLRPTESRSPTIDNSTLSPDATPYPTSVPSVSAVPSQSSVPSSIPSSSPSTPYPTSVPSVSAVPSQSSVPSSIPSSSPSVSSIPSSHPSYTPSAIPSAVPSPSPSSIPSVSAQPSAAPWTYERPPRNDLRFLPWLALNETQQLLAQQLEYDAYTWENYGRNDVEMYSWEELGEEYQGYAAELGYDQRSWDCWQNHYESYRWIDLPTTHIQALQFFDTLGYNINYWNGYTNNTSTGAGETYWYELSSEERYAASQLCFVRRSWNEEDVVYNGMFPMNKPGFRFVEWKRLSESKKEAAEVLGYEDVTWNVHGLAVVEERHWDKLTKNEKAAAKTIGWTDITWDCWQNHFSSYSWDDLQFYGLDMHYTVLGWDEESWNGESDPPSSHGKYWDLLNDIERENANALCYFRDSWDRLDMTPNNGLFPFRMPTKRYVPWKDLPNVDRQRAYDSLFYDECTWDVYGVASIESREWRDLTPWEKSEATKLGFIPNSWDCFQTHYLEKDWYDINWDIRDAMDVLGWDETSWENKTLPDSYGKKWEYLSEKEQTSANEICYFNVNWPGGTVATSEEVESFIEEVELSQTLAETKLSDFDLLRPAFSELDSSAANSVRVVGLMNLISALFVLAQLL